MLLDQTEVLFQCTTDSDGNWSDDPIDEETRDEYDEMMSLIARIDDYTKAHP